MRALTWHGKGNMRCESVPDPRIEHPRDAIIKVTACAICGSDLHIYDGVIPSMQHGDVLGHETMGEVVEVGSGNSTLRVGDRVVVPFTIACGECFCEIDPSFVISHMVPLERGPEMYKTFRDKQDGCIKVVMKP
jgi:threonine dehydrogenase-like Zn-dependent dehydrogenase